MQLLSSKESQLLNKAGVRLRSSDRNSQLEKYQDQQKKKREDRIQAHTRQLKKYEKVHQEIETECQTLNTQLKEYDVELARLNREVIQMYPSLEKVETELMNKVYTHHMSVLNAEKERLDLKQVEALALKKEEDEKKKRRWESYQAKKKTAQDQQAERERQEREGEEVDEN